jgi:tetratricopeptide (TPR) repeat protein
MPELVALLVGLSLAAGWILVPLWAAEPDAPPDSVDEREAALVRHRIALEALRDVEADRRAGSLDDAAYADELAEAEARAAATRAALDAPPDPGPAHAPSAGRRLAVGVAAVIAGVLLAGSLLPATGIANQTVVNQALADAQATETARQERIGVLLERLSADPRNADALSDLADAYLAGSSTDDLVRAAVALQVVIELDPDRADAYERIVAAYLRAGDAANARSALDAYAERPTADPVELAFLDGLIALRLEDDLDAARAAFDHFLELAPDDPRAGMVRGLRDEAGGE